MCTILSLFVTNIFFVTPVKFAFWDLYYLLYFCGTALRNKYLYVLVHTVELNQLSNCNSFIRL